MAKITLAGVDALTESGGTVSLPAAVGIAAGAVDTAELANDAVTTAKIADSPTLVTPTIASMANCTFPSGHVINRSNKVVESQDTVSTTGTSFTNSGLKHNIVAKKSSDNSYMHFEFWSGMGEISNLNARMEIQVTMKHLDEANYSSDKVLWNATYPYFMMNRGAAAWIHPIYFSTYCGLETGMGMPAAPFDEWDAGTTLHFRIFYRVDSGACRLCYGTSSYFIGITEYAR